MDLTFDDASEDFRAEVREFLAAHRDDFPTKSYDNAEGSNSTAAGTRCFSTRACR